VVQASSNGRRLVVTADGRGLEGRAGVGLLRAAADRFGLTAALRGAVDRVRSWEVHAPGAVVRDLAVMLADGGTCVSDIATLRRGHDALFATVASQPTAWRTLEAIAGDDLAVHRIFDAVATVRRRVWQLGAEPAGWDDPTTPVYVDIDATLVTAHSRRRTARRAPTRADSGSRRSWRSPIAATAAANRWGCCGHRRGHRQRAAHRRPARRRPHRRARRHPTHRNRAATTRPGSPGRWAVAVTPRIRPRPGVRYRVVVTETIDDVDDTDDEFDDVVFDHTGDAFVVGVANLSGTRITAEVNHDGDQFLRERLTVYITNTVLDPEPDGR